MRAPSLAVLNVRRCDRCTRTPHRPRTRNPLASIESAQLLFLHCAPLALREHTCVSLCLSHDYDFFRVLFRSRAPPPTSTPPSPPSPRASPPRDSPILRPRAGLVPLSRACDSPFAMSFGATRRTRSPSSLRHAVGCCMSASRPFKRPSSLEPCCGPRSPCAAESHASCSQDDRDAPQLCSGEDQCPQQRNR